MFGDEICGQLCSTLPTCISCCVELRPLLFLKVCLCSSVFPLIPFPHFLLFCFLFIVLFCFVFWFFLLLPPNPAAACCCCCKTRASSWVFCLGRDGNPRYLVWLLNCLGCSQGTCPSLSLSLRSSVFVFVFFFGFLSMSFTW